MSRAVKKLRNAKATATSLADLDVESVFDVSNVGWNNLETKYNELTAMLSAPTAGLNANQARMQQKKAVSQAITKLLDMAQQECRRLLIEGNAKAAVEGGLKTLKLKELYYGQGSLQLVPAYFHLARTNQYMDRFKPAEEFLSLAQWTILKHPETDVSLKAELHQTFGLLYASDGKLDAALQQLTSATYYLCTMNGPEHILTSFGYFDLGNVFAASSNMENAMAFYDKVKDIWYTHLTMALAVVNETAAGEEPEESDDPAMKYATPIAFGEENLQDAVKMLRGIVGLQCERYGRVHPSAGRAEQVMGMFFLWNGDNISALDSLLRSLEIFKRLYGERHPLASEVRSLLLQYGMEVPDDTSHVLQIAPVAAEEDEQPGEQQEEAFPQQPPEEREEAPQAQEEEPSASQQEGEPAAAETSEAQPSDAAPGDEAKEPEQKSDTPASQDAAATPVGDSGAPSPAETPAAGEEGAAPEETAATPVDAKTPSPTEEPEQASADQPAAEASPAEDAAPAAAEEESKDNAAPVDAPAETPADAPAATETQPAATPTEAEEAKPDEAKAATPTEAPSAPAEGEAPAAPTAEGEAAPTTAEQQEEREEEVKERMTAM